MIIQQKYRIYPNPSQQQTLTDWMNASRFVWNHYLEKNIKTYEDSKRFIFKFDMNKDITVLKKTVGFEWLAQVPSQVLQQKSANLDTALKRCFKKISGFPKFKSRKQDGSGISFPQHAKIQNGRLSLPKMKTGIRIKQHRPFLGTPGTCTVKKTSSGEWYAVFVVKDCSISEMKSEITSSIGIDVGIMSFATLSNGETLGNPRFLKKSTNKIKKLQRRLSRKKKGSNNKNKQRILLARAHTKVTNQRKDHTNKIANSIAKNFDLVCIEDLDIKQMMSNSYYSSSIADVSWGMFFHALAWQCVKSGTHLVKVDRYFPSSQLCSSCGNRKKMPIHVRTYSCDICDIEMDRDLNAALNIVQQGTKLHIGQELPKSTPVRYDYWTTESAQEAAGSEDPQ
jgi:putative transposase